MADSAGIPPPVATTVPPGKGLEVKNPPAPVPTLGWSCEGCHCGVGDDGLSTEMPGGGLSGDEKSRHRPHPEAPTTRRLNIALWKRSVFTAAPWPLSVHPGETFWRWRALRLPQGLFRHLGRSFIVALDDDLLAAGAGDVNRLHHIAVADQLQLRFLSAGGGWRGRPDANGFSR